MSKIVYKNLLPDSFRKNQNTTKKTVNHFIDIDKICYEDLHEIISIAKHLKKNVTPLQQRKMLQGKNLAMIFEKTSTRTRVSFEVGINQLGGHAVVMNVNDMQLGKGESIDDTAKVLSRFVDAIMIRSNTHKTILDLAKILFQMLGRVS